MDGDPTNTHLRWNFDLTTLRELHARAENGDAEAAEDRLDWVCVRGLAVPLIDTAIGLADEVAAYSEAPVADEVRNGVNHAISALNIQSPLTEALALAVVTLEENPKDLGGAVELASLMAAGYLTLLIDAVAGLHELTRALVAYLYPIDPQAATWLTDRLPDLPGEGTAAERLPK